MENLTHTLLGLTLAKAGLERATPLATSALVISSNLPDIDVLTRIGGTTGSYLEYHRGITHSFVGLAVLAAALTLLLTWIDRRFRLGRDPFRRPLRAWRIFAISYFGGLMHLLLDFTNVYGVRPLLPFSNRWFYGDLIFVVDPWMWLILGSTTAWLSLGARSRSVNFSPLLDWLKLLFWLIAGAGTSLLVALAMRTSSDTEVAIPTLVRVIWFAGLLMVVFGLAYGWGRAGGRLARYALVLLAIYYGGMMVAHQIAIERARKSITVEGVTGLSAWPMPANPLMWEAVATTESIALKRYVSLASDSYQWRESSLIDQRFVEALRQSKEASRFLDFARYLSARVDEREDGYSIWMRDLRFSLHMHAELDRDLSVKSADVGW